MPNPNLSEHNRRPVRARSKSWAKALASILNNLGVWPNQVSVSSILIAAIGSACLLAAASDNPPHNLTIALIGFIVAMQLRVVANMIDGMLAIEGGKTSAVGELYNDVPDRITDTIFFVTAGYVCAWTFDNQSLIWIGWALSLGAMGTAYIRLLGGSIGIDQDFTGPMAKRTRMFVLSLGALVAVVQASQGAATTGLLWGLVIVFIGTYITLVRRLYQVTQGIKKTRAPVESNVERGAVGGE